MSVAGRLGTRRTAKAGKTVTTRVGSRVLSVLVARCLCSALLAALRRRRGRLPIARKIWSELRGAFWQSRTNSIKSMPCRRRWWRGLVSNQRRRKPTDLQSVPFSHSGTSPSALWALGQPSQAPRKSGAPRRGGGADSALYGEWGPMCQLQSPYPALGVVQDGWQCHRTRSELQVFLQTGCEHGDHRVVDQELACHPDRRGERVPQQRRPEDRHPLRDRHSELRRDVRQDKGVNPAAICANC